ncbi:proline--tRNA ligase [Egibacter rhizosphaerae]|uniref:Proline--tRNA ligase n=1 Tax=Egibacter rhizosphaerae TaxID=1670831 RepID=A0A411YAK1_9ACTN|nr:proline--tRNA ligase [Egibacter rhizosphaerae]QBI18208.1 proline--tRNA ligase [Egibacter rhizosphaerae]
MRQSQLLLQTLREPPGDAEAASHRLLARAGYIRRLASGIYSYLPLGLRALQNVERIVREEMDGIGCQELLLPALHPEEVWIESGRSEAMDEVLMRVDARAGRFVLGPTHEEVVTALVDAEVSSYRELPRHVYQIQTKFRDEVRPRFGLLRVREFGMKDAYSFDTDAEAMRTTYRQFYDAYRRIFDRCELPYTAVEALAGAIGGDVNHEFMVPSPIGEDRFAWCTGCGHAANIEAAGAGWPEKRPQGEQPLETHHTPGADTIDGLVEFFADRGITARDCLKTMAAKDPDGNVVVLLVPGDRDFRLGGLEPLDDEGFAVNPALSRGYLGPMGLQEHGVEVVADPLVAGSGPWITGANVPEHHVTGATLDRDFTVDTWRPCATVADGDPCPECETGELRVEQAVEAGHTFQLGTTYSAAPPGATYVDEHGHEQVMWMGCYGIGIGRTLAVAAEAHHDDEGLAWPIEVAPFAVHLLALGGHRNAQVAEAAERLYRELAGAGIAVLYDDRETSPGVKFADADLLGMPTQLVVGGKGLERGVVERKDRRSGERDELPLDDAVGLLAG